MAIISITDAQIRSLIEMPKLITNPGARWRQLERARLKDYDVIARADNQKFSIFVRQSTKMESSFSAGLIWHSGEEKLVLMRCNGSSHVHGNKLEQQTIRLLPHIHIATERYISIGKKDEGYAEATNAYSNIQGALLVLMQRCNISSRADGGPVQEELFNNA